MRMSNKHTHTLIDWRIHNAALVNQPSEFDGALMLDRPYGHFGKEFVCVCKAPNSNVNDQLKDQLKPLKAATQSHIER